MESNKNKKKRAKQKFIGRTIFTLFEFAVIVIAIILAINFIKGDDDIQTSSEDTESKIVSDIIDDTTSESKEESSTEKNETSKEKTDISKEEPSVEPSEEPSKEVSEPVSEEPFTASFRVMIDPGHIVTYDDYGHVDGMNEGVAYNYYEGYGMWLLANKLKSKLEKYGIAADLTRNYADEMQVSLNPGEYKVDMWHRENVARGEKAKGYDMFISLHSNALVEEPSLRRVIVYKPYFHASSEMNKFAEEVALGVRDVLNVPKKEGSTNGYQVIAQLGDDGKDENFAVMQGARAVGCEAYFLVEHSFHTNTETCKMLTTDSILDQIAEVEAKAIYNYYLLKTKNK